jgi:hypothetical protein
MSKTKLDLSDLLGALDLEVSKYNEEDEEELCQIQDSGMEQEGCVEGRARTSAPVPVAYEDAGIAIMDVTEHEYSGEGSAMEIEEDGYEDASEVDLSSGGASGACGSSDDWCEFAFSGLNFALQERYIMGQILDGNYEVLLD